MAASLGALILVACGTAQPSPTAVPPPSQAALGAFPRSVADGLHTETDIAYTDVTECGGTPCRVPGDVLAPLSGSDLPTVVMLHGGGTRFEGRRYMQDLAAEVARRGAVVFLLSYRSAATGNYDSAGFNDARCAVRFARAETEAYGGDPDRVAVIGHSQGGWLGLSIALEPETDAEACLADGSGQPDAVIGLGAPAPSLADADPFAPPIWLFFGSADSIAQGTPGRLEDAGLDVEVAELAGVTHQGIVDPAEAPDVVDLIQEALDSI